MQLFIEISDILLQFVLIGIGIPDTDEDRDHIGRRQEDVLDYAPDRGERVQLGYIFAVQFLALSRLARCLNPDATTGPDSISPGFNVKAKAATGPKTRRA